MNQKAGLFVFVRLSWADESKQTEWGCWKQHQKLVPPHTGKAACAGREAKEEGDLQLQASR